MATLVKKKRGEKEKKKKEKRGKEERKQKGKGTTRKKKKGTKGAKEEKKKERQRRFVTGQYDNQYPSAYDSTAQERNASY